MTEQYDVIVVGGGGSGLAAAVRAAEQGCRVLLLEKNPELGGTTRLAVGSFTANRTPAQEARSIQDTPEAHAEDAGQFAPAEIEARNNSALRAYFLQETAETHRWLTDLGLRFNGPHPEPPNRVPRMHNVIPGARAYIRTLADRFKTLGGEIRLPALVTELLQKDGRVTGVCYQYESVAHTAAASGGIVLAGGDYANATDLVSRFKGEAFGLVEGINPNATGEGHLLAESAGAALLNMDVTYGPEIRFIPPKQPRHPLDRMLQRHVPTPLATAIARATPAWLIRRFAKRMIVTWQHPEEQLFHDGAILINRQGQRFCNECSSPDRELALATQPEKVAWMLLDQTLIAKYSAWPHFVSTAPEIAYAYVADYLKLRPDIAQEAPSLDTFSQTVPFPSDSLRETVSAYNRSIENEERDPHERPDRRLLNGNRWVLLGPAKAYFTTTEGGAAINTRCQVLREDGQVIPGLYAVGQNGLGGQILWGHGLHIAWAMTSGRLVGQQFQPQ